MGFPSIRMRRLRQSETLRSLVRETRLTPESFVYPLFVCPGEGIRREVSSMPGVFNLSIDEVIKDVAECRSLGIPGVILFGLPEGKDEIASGAWAEDGIVQRATRAIKAEVKNVLVIGDVCLCEYMSHGHCGIIERKRSAPPEPPMRMPVHSFAAGATTAAGRAPKHETSSAASTSPDLDFEIVNDATLELLAKTAISLADAGVDIIAPSDMMDGRVHAIRQALDAEGQNNVPILSYAAKFASAFYGPFREAADSAPQFGDRRSYQMDGANLREAMREIELDLAEGADMVMVKPALPYLDVIAAARQRFDLPLAAYQVSGEYAMIQAAARNGWVDGQRVMLESLT
ncbi:MAG TPA: porphobilinogen synthase, partial [Terriglobales bacterium]|nr:porphobilinogen synthase [Terriglobales bacterium]